MNFIFMLTQSDQTVPDARQVLEIAIEQGVRHLGFKDVGASREQMKSITKAIGEAGGTSYMEVVSTTSESVRRSMETAREIGVDYVLGGQDLESAREILEGGLARYYPFPGRPRGHPTSLGGTPEDIARDCRAFVEAGCAGVDLLAYRATEADPLELVRTARANLSGRGLIVAGSIDRPERIHALARAGVDAFTIGSAIFDGSFSPSRDSMPSRLKDVLDVCANAPCAA